MKSLTFLRFFSRFGFLESMGGTLSPPDFYDALRIPCRDTKEILLLTDTCSTIPLGMVLSVSGTTDHFGKQSNMKNNSQNFKADALSNKGIV